MDMSENSYEVHDVESKKDADLESLSSESSKQNQEQQSSKKRNKKANSKKYQEMLKM